MGTTSGGAPYGLTIDEFRRSAEEGAREAPWARAKRALLRAFAWVEPGVHLDVGYVDAHGKGLSRDGFVAEVEIDPDPRAMGGSYVALVAHHKADAGYPARVEREARVLEWIWPRILGVRVPRALALIDDVYAPILVESFTPGIVADLRQGRMPITPWRTVATVAAAIHRVEPPPADVLPTRDRTRHRADLLHELFADGERMSGLLGDAYAWMCEHIDRPGPGVLLHGDLKGHHLRLYPGGDIGVIDWEYTELGDPAHDLAVVTRGVRGPFQLKDGRARLLAAYAQESPIEVTGADLRFFELTLHVRWAKQRTPNLQESESAITRLLRDA